MINKKVYLGDGVYAMWNGYEIILTTQNGLPDDPSNTIVLKGAVLKDLFDFDSRICLWIKQQLNP